MWLAFRPPIQAASPPDTTEMHVGIGWWEWQLTYRTPRPLDQWYFPVVHQLEAAGWTRRQAGYAGRPLPFVDPVAYERRTSFEFVVLWERVELAGDLHGARMQLRRWIAIQPLKL
jgi:hypothetical protein